MSAKWHREQAAHLRKSEAAMRSEGDAELAGDYARLAAHHEAAAEALVEAEALRARVAALEAAVAGFFVESRGEGQRVQYVEHDRPMSFSEREWNRHLRALRDALSGGTAALDAHDAALMDRVRARVEAVPPFIVDGGRTVAVLHAAVLDALAVEGVARLLEGLAHIVVPANSPQEKALRTLADAARRQS